MIFSVMIGIVIAGVVYGVTGSQVHTIAGFFGAVAGAWLSRRKSRP